MKIYIIRHAETEYNNKGIIQGSEVDSDINSTGEKQSLSFFNFYKDYPEFPNNEHVEALFEELESIGVVESEQFEDSKGFALKDSKGYAALALMHSLYNIEKKQNEGDDNE